MNGHVFQVHREQSERGQFQDTLDMLRVYASKCMKKDINTLNPLFTELIEPVIQIPIEPKGNTISRFDEKKYDVELTMYFKNRTSLENALQSLYIITWGQCSKLMKNRLEAGQGFKIINDDGDIAKLLTEIRGVSNEVEVSSNVYDALDGSREDTIITIKEIMIVI